jgi:ketosteroid isomerase-like protein
MSQENVEIVRALYEALRGNDIEGALDLLSPTSSWTTRDREDWRAASFAAATGSERSSRGCSNHSPTTSRSKRR